MEDPERIRPILIFILICNKYLKKEKPKIKTFRISFKRIHLNFMFTYVIYIMIFLESEKSCQ